MVDTKLPSTLHHIERLTEITNVLHDADDMILKLSGQAQTQRGLLLQLRTDLSVILPAIHDMQRLLQSIAAEEVHDFDHAKELARQTLEKMK